MNGVSVVIPTHNHAGYIRQAIDSALAQTSAPLEVIVVDDGSTDETPRILADYGGRIRAIRQSNAGVSVARNTGIAAAAGDLIALLDSDDSWAPTKLERQIARLSADPGVGLVHCGSERVDEAGRRLSAGGGARRRKAHGEEACRPLCNAGRTCGRLDAARHQSLRRPAGAAH